MSMAEEGRRQKQLRLNDRGKLEMGSRLIGHGLIGVAARRLWQHAGPRAGKSLVDLVYPPRCLWCHNDAALSNADEIALCEDCRTELAPPVLAWCGRCGAPLGGSLAVDFEAPSEDCMHCRDEKFPWQRVVALGVYAGELGQAIVATKSAHADALSTALGKLLLSRRRATLEELRCDVVVPVPLHWARRLKRGT